MDIMARLGLDSTSFERGLKKSESRIKKFAGQMRKVGSTFGTLGLGMLIKKSIDAGSAITDMALATQTGIEEIQILNYAAKEAGASQEQMANLLVKVRKSAADAARGLATAKDAYKLLGIDAEKFLDLKPEEMLEVMGKALVDADGDTRAYGAALDLLGTRNAPKLMEVLQRLGVEGFEAVGKQAKDAGQVMEEDLARQLDEAADAMIEFETVVTNSVGIMVGKFMDLGKGIGNVVGKLVFGSDKQMDFKLARKQAVAEFERDGKGLNSAKITERARAILKEWAQHQEKIKAKQDELAKKEDAATAAKVEVLEATIENQGDIAKQQKTLKGKISSATSAISKLMTGARDALSKRDAGKMSVRELANLDKFMLGVGSKAGMGGDTAREIIQLEKEAERQRKRGNMADDFGTGYEGRMAEALKKRKGLFESGLISSEELPEGTLEQMAKDGVSGPVAMLQEEIQTSNDHLAKIEKAVKADRVNTA